MKLTALTVALMVTGMATTLQAVTVMNSSDLLFIVGSGANQSNLVIDFNDGQTRESFAWGYRYDGVASGQDLLAAVAAADPNLAIDSSSFLGTASFFDGVTSHIGTSDFGAGAVSWGYYLSGGFAGDDLPGEGGNPNSILGGGSELPTTWTLSPTGPAGFGFGETGRLLTDGSWDAWSFGNFDPDTFAHLAAPGPEAPFAAAVPEPSSFSFLLLATGLLARRRRG